VLLYVVVYFYIFFIFSVNIVNP